MVEAVVMKLEEQDMLDNTYIVYTTDNGFHVGQHRLQPGKYCPFEEDIHIPLIIRGPGVPENHSTEIVTTHTDLAPTFLRMIGASMHADFDGEAIPLTKDTMNAAVDDRYEHVQVEYWGFALSESKYRYEGLISHSHTGIRSLALANDWQVAGFQTIRIRHSAWSALTTIFTIPFGVIMNTSYMT